MGFREKTFKIYRETFKNDKKNYWNDQERIRSGIREIQAHETKDYVSILSIQTLIVTIVRCFNPKLGNVQSGSWKFILVIHRIAFCIKGGKS